MPSPHLPWHSAAAGGWRTAHLPPTFPPPPHMRVHHTHAHRYIPHVCASCAPHTHTHTRVPIRTPHVCTTHVCAHMGELHTPTDASHTCIPHMHPLTPLQAKLLSAQCCHPAHPFPTFTRVPRQPESAGASLSSKGCDHARHLLGAPMNREQIPYPLAAGPAVHTPPTPHQLHCVHQLSLHPSDPPPAHSCWGPLSPAAPLGGAVCSPAAFTPPATLPHPQSGSCQQLSPGILVFICLLLSPQPPSHHCPLECNPGSWEGPLEIGKGQRVPTWVFSIFHVSLCHLPQESLTPQEPLPSPNRGLQAARPPLTRAAQGT